MIPDAIFTIKALIISRNKPSVRIVTGMVIITRMGLTKMFRMDNIIATKTALKKPSMLMPGSQLAKATIASAFIISFSIVFILILLRQ